MKRFIGLILVVAFLFLLLGNAFADNGQEQPDFWFPFNIKLTDDYSIAKGKVLDVLADEPCNSRTNYVQILPEKYYLYNLPIKEISVMNREGRWRVFLTSSVTQTETDIENIYKFYMALVEKLGEPVEASPTERHATFDGEEEICILASQDSFMSSALSAEYGTKYTAKYKYLEYEVNIWDKEVQVILTFNNEELSDEDMV